MSINTVNRLETSVDIAQGDIILVSFKAISENVVSGKIKLL
jgi:hypothetical protein